MRKFIAAVVSAGVLVVGAGPALAGVVNVKAKANNLRVCNNRCDIVDVGDVGVNLLNH